MMDGRRKAKEARGKVEADVVLGQIPPEAVGLEIVHKLAAKGFCVVSPGFDDDILSKALDEIQEFDMLGRWNKVNSIIQDGLLGSEGSCQIAELESPDLDDEVRSDGEMLMKLDYTITHVGFRLEPYLDHLGFEVSHRSLAIVHRTAEPDEQATPPLNEKVVMKWMAQFIRHRIMVIIFLGPTPGTLELLPYKTEDTEIHELQTQPGMVVILRPDLMSHKHFSPGRSIAISAFFLSGFVSTSSVSDTVRLIPAAQELDEWTLSRLQELKAMSEEGVWNPGIPRDWQHAMNHLFIGGQMISVRSSALKCCMHDEISTLWTVSTNGPDYVTDVPLLRWDHSEVYDPDMESWRYYKSHCRHASFMDGIELFDCKMFSMSPNEAKVMDPHQRLILEIGYASLHNAGLRKNTLVNTACGVYVGCGNMEWANCPKEESGAFGATGGALSISSGRFSFTLGLKGPSMTLDTEACSGCTAIHLGADSLEKKGRAATNEWSVAVGANIQLSPLMWPNLCAMGSLSCEGRCFSFNASAAGYVRGDGVAACVLKLAVENVDDDFVATDVDKGALGTLCGSTMNNNGKGASLTAPSGPAEQEAIADAVGNANISVFDVESVEAFASGGFLADAIEVGSLIRAHRTEDVKDPLAITALKSSFGNQNEPSGIVSFCKVLVSSEWGIMTPNLHLWQCNPHIESFDQPTTFVTQSLTYRMASSFAGVMSRGNGGSNVYLLTWGQRSDLRMPPPTVPSNREVLSFWPGGGGNLDADKRPTKDYTIVGSWGQWPDPQPMEPEGDGVYSYVMTLGENRWEWFVIWLDGDPNRILHPGYHKASKDFPVLGPVEDAEGACWEITGLMETVYVPIDQTESIADGGYEVVTDEFGQQVASYQVVTADAGVPGDKYRITLRVAGKWRTVTWERIKPLTDSQDTAVVATPPVGKYYLCSDWNGWDLDAFEADESQPGVYYKEIVMTENQHEFQIVRNRDYNQVIFPSAMSYDGREEVVGPATGGDFTWCIKGAKDAKMVIEFQRQADGKADGKADRMKVSWREGPRTSG